MIMTPGDAIRAEDLPPEIRSESPSRPPAMEPFATAPQAPSDGGAAPPATPPAGTLREFKESSERSFLVQKLRENAWNISRTAEVIGTPRSNLYKKLEQYGITQELDGS